MTSTRRSTTTSRCCATLADPRTRTSTAACSTRRSRTTRRRPSRSAGTSAQPRRGARRRRRLRLRPLRNPLPEPLLLPRQGDDREGHQRRDQRGVHDRGLRPLRRRGQGRLPDGQPVGQAGTSGWTSSTSRSSSTPRRTRVIEIPPLDFTTGAERAGLQQGPRRLPVLQDVRRHVAPGRRRRSGATARRCTSSAATSRTTRSSSSTRCPVTR